MMSTGEIVEQCAPPRASINWSAATSQPAKCCHSSSICQSSSWRRPALCKHVQLVSGGNCFHRPHTAIVAGHYWRAHRLQYTWASCLSVTQWALTLNN